MINMSFLLAQIMGLCLFLNIYEIPKEWKQIENSLYSIKLPPSWEAMYENTSMVPSQRKVTIKGTSFELHNLIWADNKNDINGYTMINIDSYKKMETDGMSLKDLEDLLIKVKVHNESLIKVLDKSVSDTHKRFFLIEKNMSMSATGGVKEFESPSYHLFVNGNGMIHHIDISLSSNSKISKEVVENILNSFNLK